VDRARAAIVLTAKIDVLNIMCSFLRRLAVRRASGLPSHDDGPAFRSLQVNSL